MRTESDRNGSDKTANIHQRKASRVLSGGSKSIKRDVQRTCNDGNKHRPSHAYLFHDLNDHKAQEDIPNRVQGAQNRYCSYIPTNIFRDAREKYSQAGADSKIHKDDQKRAQRRFIAKELFRAFHDTFPFLL